MSILLYVKLFQCSIFPQIYAQLEEGVVSVCQGVQLHSSICKPYLVQQFFHRSMLNWEGVVSSAKGIGAVKLIWVGLLQRSMPWRRGWGQSAKGIGAFFYMLNLFGVVVFHRSMLNGGWDGGGPSALQVWPHCSLGYTVFGVVGLCMLGVNQLGRDSSFLNTLHWFGVVGLCTLGINQQGRASSFLNMLYWFGVDQLGRDLLVEGSICTGYGLIAQCRLYQFGVVGLCICETWGQLAMGRDSSFLNTLHWFGVVGLCTLRANQQGRASSFLNMLYWFGVVVSWRSMCLIGGGGPSALGMASLLNRLYQFGVVGLCTLGVNQQGRDSSFLNTLHWLGVVGLCTLGINQQGRASSFLNRLSLFGVVGLCTLGLNQQGRDSSFLNSSYYIGVVGLYTWGQLAGEGLPISQQVILVWCSRAQYTWA